MADSDLELRVAWDRHIGRSPECDRAFDAVLARYREPHRRYHTVRHLRWVVRHVTELSRDHRLADLAAVVAAAFYHDAIYDPLATDNEAASARLATAELTALGWAFDGAERVAALIVGTATHDVTDVSLDEATLYAADLAVLAADPSSYGDYVRNVRHEYAHVDEPSWVTGRSAVMHGFLDRPAIYAPMLRLDAWEARARANITAELQRLSG